MDAEIFKVLKDNGIPNGLALNIVAQARLETDDYNSVVFKKYNNLFGYGFSNSKWQSSKSKPVGKNGEPLNWAVYKSKTDSVREIADYWKRRLAEKTISDLSQVGKIDTFAKVLKSKGYYSATYPAYLSGLNSKLKNIDIDSPQNKQTIVYFLLFAVITTIIIRFSR